MQIEGALAIRCKLSPCVLRSKAHAKSSPTSWPTTSSALSDVARLGEFLKPDDPILTVAKTKVEARAGGRKALKRVRVLDFTKAPFNALANKATTLEVLKALTKLKTPIAMLRVPRNETLASRLASAKSFPKIRPHTIISFSDDLELDPRQLAEVRYLQMYNSAADFAVACPKLLSLSLVCCDAPSLKGLRAAARLTTLQLCELDNLDDDKLKGLRECKSLTSLDISCNDALRGVGLLSLVDLNLRSLNLSWLSFPSEAKEDHLHVLGWKSCLERLAPKLTSLDLRYTKVREADMKDIWPLCKRLTTLKLQGTLCELSHERKGEEAKSNAKATAAIDPEVVEMLTKAAACSKVVAAATDMRC